LVGKKIIAVVNFPAKKVAGISSQVLVLAAVCAEKRAVLLTPDLDAPLGARVA
jgi:tRNA-binding protein